MANYVLEREWHKNQLIAQHEDGTVLLKFSSNQNRCKKIMKTNDFYKIINGIGSFFEKEAMILLSRK